MELIRFGGPWITELEENTVIDAVRNGWGAQNSAYIKKLEDITAQKTNTKYAIATSSCTGALHLSLETIKRRSKWPTNPEIIIPANTWAATAAVATYVGATPVFVDVLPDVYTIDPVAVKNAITDKTVAIMPVHMYGYPADMDAILEIAGNIPVVEDAAPAMGSKYKGKSVGGLGSIGCFSFQGAKVLVAGEGGIIVTNDKDIYDMALYISNQCRSTGFVTHAVGLKYKMNNISAALAYSQMVRLDEIIEKRRQIYHWYKDNLEGTVIVTPQGGATNDYWSNAYLTTLLFETSDQLDQVTNALDNNYSAEIEYRRFFPALQRTPAYSVYTKHETPVVYDTESKGICLPCATFLERGQIDYVCDVIKKELK